MSPDFPYVHTSESLAALPEPSPEVTLVPPPPADFSFSHSFLASLSMPGDKSVCDDGIALEGPAKLPIFGAAAAALPVPSSTAATSPDFTYVHTSESLAALPEPSPEVALVPPPPVDFSFSHSFLASLSMPGDKSVCDDGIVLEGPAKLPIFGAAAAALPVPSSTAAMSPDFPDVRACPAGEVLRTLPASVAYPVFRAARTCPEGHAMIRVVDGCDDDYLCPQCDDCSDQF